MFMFVLVALTITISSNLFAEGTIQKIEIKTSAICGHCKENIEGALKKVDGVVKSTLDVDTKIATVEFDSQKTNADDIRKTISNTGYHADEVKRDARAYKRLPKCCKEK
jgi:copper chaperone CopZ